MSGTLDTPPTLAEAQAELDAIAAQESEWTARRATLAGQLAGRERGAAGAALAGTATAKLSAELGRLRDELGMAEGALALLVTRREVATYRVRLADYHDRRARHDALLAEAEGLWGELQAAWGPLAALTGADFGEMRAAFARTPRLRGLEDRAERLRGDINYRADALREEDRSYL
jgi:phosphoglycolate phosphatase-like HAD superfamily hydrolase